jgi:hypothetical protein
VLSPLSERSIRPSAEDSTSISTRRYTIGKRGGSSNLSDRYSTRHPKNKLGEEDSTLAGGGRTTFWYRTWLDRSSVESFFLWEASGDETGAAASEGAGCPSWRPRRRPAEDIQATAVGGDPGEAARCEQGGAVGSTGNDEDLEEMDGCHRLGRSQATNDRKSEAGGGGRNADDFATVPARKKTTVAMDPRTKPMKETSGRRSLLLYCCLLITVSAILPTLRSSPLGKGRLRKERVLA